MQDNAYDLTREILEDLYASAQTPQDLHLEISKNLLKILETQKISIDDNSEKIRKAIVHFYKAYGFSVLIVFQKNHTLKLIPALQDHHNNLYINMLSKWIESHFDENQKLNEEIFQQIFSFIKEKLEIQDELLCREIARHAIKKFFKLDMRDSLFFKNLGLFVKKFDYDFVKVNQDLRRINKLDSSVLLNENDRSYISYLLKHIPLKKRLTAIAHKVLQTKMQVNMISQPNFYQTFTLFVVQEFRFEINKTLNDSIDGLGITCFAEEYVRNHKNIIFLALAKWILRIHYYHPEKVENFSKRYFTRIPLNNPKFKNISQTIYTPDLFNQVCQEYFTLQETLDSFLKKIQEFEHADNEKNQIILKTQEEIKTKNLILQNLNDAYENKKNDLKKKRGNIDQEAENIKLSSFISEQKFILDDLEMLAKKTEEYNKEKTEILNLKQDTIREMQKVQIRSQAIEKDFDLLAQSLGGLVEQSKL